MGAYNVINRASMAAGQPEDITQVLANFDAIAALLNGNLDNSNINAAAALAIAKLAGYPADGTKALFGDGSWKVVSTSLTIDAQAASYTAVLADANNIVEILNAGAVNLTIPPNSSVAFPIGSSIAVIQTGVGQITVVPGAGVTINANPGLKLAGQWAMASLVKRATDTWILAGNISS